MTFSKPHDNSCANSSVCCTKKSDYSKPIFHIQSSDCTFVVDETPEILSTALQSTLNSIMLCYTYYNENVVII